MKSAIFVFLIFTLAGCRNQSNLLPELKIGSNEDQWKTQLNSLLKSGTLQKDQKDTLYFSYLLKLLDTTINTRVSVNDDGYEAGNLRMIKFVISDKLNSEPANEQSNVPEVDTSGISAVGDSNMPDTSGHVRNTIRMDPTQMFGLFDFCNKSTFDKVFKYLVSVYGKPDSTGYEFNIFSKNPDTTSVSYYFNERDFNIQMNRSYKEETLYNDQPYYSYGEVILTHKNLEKELDFAKKEAFKRLKPADYFEVSFGPVYRDMVAPPGWSFKTDVLIVQPVSVFNFAYADNRNVVKAKGTLQILDKFNDILFESIDHEITAPKLLPASQRGHGSFNASLYPGDFKILIFLKNKSITQKLLNAVASNNELKAKFIPEAIVLEDDSVIR